MKYLIIIICILSYNLVFAQNTEGESDNFNLIIALKYEGDAAIQITISDKEEDADLFFRGTDCDARVSRGIDIIDTYYYNQFKDYLNQIDIVTFEPSSVTDAALQIKMVYINQNTDQRAAYQFGYNPEDFSELDLLFEYLLQTMDANAVRSCDRDFYEKVKGYLEGEE